MIGQFIRWLIYAGLGLGPVKEGTSLLAWLWKGAPVDDTGTL